MASTPTSRLRLVKQATFSNPQTWGEWLNTGALDRVDEAFGVVTVVVSADVTLTANDFLADQARAFVLVFTGTGSFTVTVPAIDKVYMIDNRCIANVAVKPAGGTASTIVGESRAMWFTDGTTGYTGPSTTFDASDAFSAQSATANVIGTGSKVYTIASGKGFSVGMNVRIADNAAPSTKYMDGVVTAYSGTSLTVLVASVAGSGTPATVTIGFSQAQIALPDQTGNSGKKLTTNGVSPQWTAESIAFTEYLTTTTWTKPTCTFVLVEAWAGAGGGGSGRRGAAGSARGGGTGSGGGGHVPRIFRASDLPASVLCTIGAGGAGGAAVTVNDTSGNAGVAGGNTTFGTFLTAYGGAAGLGGTAANIVGGGGGGALGAGVAGAGGAPTSSGSTEGGAFGGAAGATGNGLPSGWGGASGGGGGGGFAGAGGCAFLGGAGGGCGGFITAANASGAGGAGGSNAGASGGGGVAGAASAGAALAGSNGGAGLTERAGGGGGGGGGTTSGVGGNGGAGLQPGAGGGGGGAATNGSNSGAGGAGGNGSIRIYCF